MKIILTIYLAVFLGNLFTHLTGFEFAMARSCCFSVCPVLAVCTPADSFKAQKNCFLADNIKNQIEKGVFL